MRVVSIALGTALSLVATAAGAAELEARNPFHCSLAMQISYERAKEVRGADDAILVVVAGRPCSSFKNHCPVLATVRKWWAIAGQPGPTAIDSSLRSE